MFRRTGILLSVLLTCFLAGCGSEPTKPTPQSAPPTNDTPQNTMLRFLATYKGKMTAEYEALFTGDFAYEFSNSTDPTLVTKWSAGWYAQDESLSAQHLFQGGTNLDGQFQPAATTIDITLSPTVPVDDPYGRDPATYKVLVADVGGSIVIPPIPPGYDPVTFVFSGNRNSFYLVRGDAAQGLKASQPADANHWYIWHWKDETQSGLGPESPALAPLPAQTSTWGRLKALFR